MTITAGAQANRPPPGQEGSLTAAHPPRWLGHFWDLAVSSLTMTMWLTLILALGLFARPLGATIRVWLVYLPVFLMLDFIRHKAVGDPAAYMAWLKTALASARRGERDASARGRLRRLIWCRGILFLLGAYIVAFVLDPAVRGPAETLDHFPWVEHGYEVIDMLYPAAVREPAHIIAIGHIQDAYDLRHFITLCLILSLATVFLWTGPGRRECADWLMLKIVRQATTTPQRRFAINSPGGVGVFCLILSSGGLALFDLVGTINGSMNYYWRLEAFPPCLVFQTGAWLFSCGIGLLSLAADASLLQPTVPA